MPPRIALISHLLNAQLARAGPQLMRGLLTPREPGVGRGLANMIPGHSTAKWNSNNSHPLGGADVTFFLLYGEVAEKIADCASAPPSPLERRACAALSSQVAASAYVRVSGSFLHF
jgi:hypothetical protein